MASGLSVFALAAAQAHHSFAKFDRTRSVEVEGEIVAVHWQNPHVHFTLRGSLGEGPVQEWDLETNSPGILRRSDAERPPGAG